MITMESLSSMPSSFRVISDDLGPYYDQAIISGVDKVTRGLARQIPKVEAYAQQNAPWSDITGAARAGLTADVIATGEEAILTLSHSVSYGVWLELIQNGKYAIILPTLEALGRDVAIAAGGEFMGAGGGAFL